MATLFEIEKEHAEIINQVIEAEGELTPELAEALELNEENLKEKAKGYLDFISSQKARICTINDEIARLTAMKKSVTNKIDWLSGKLLGAVNQYGEFEVGLTKVGSRKSEGVIITSEDMVPPEFTKSEVVTKINKAEIKKVLKGGGLVSGAELEQRTNLKIN